MRTHAKLSALALLLLCCQPKDRSPKEKPRAELRKASEGDVASVVQAAAADAQQDSRRLVVYVGATWCEPCRYFLDAIATDALPHRFDDLRFLKFDFDHDEARLEARGFGGDMLPRFILVDAEGKPTDRRFEGSIKGPRAVEDLVGKLDWLFAKSDRP